MLKSSSCLLRYFLSIYEYMIVVRELHPLLLVQVNKEATGPLLLANTGTGIWLAAVTLGKIHTLQSGNKSYSLNTFS